MVFKVDWDDEIKARLYLTSTKVLNLLSTMNDIKNFKDKKTTIYRYGIRFSFERSKLSELSDSHFPSIKFIINEAKTQVFEANEALKIYDKYACIMKK